MNPSTELARSVVTALRGAAVREVVLAPGSRNAPLSFALYDVAATGGLRLHTRIDERTAGFLALGLAKVSGRAAAVLCTSGTAVANLRPAVVEAAHAGVPLLLVRLGLDPAVASNPFITSLCDITGLIVYLEIAQLFLD